MRSHHHGHRAAHMPELTAPLVPVTLAAGLGAVAGLCALLLLRRAGLRFTWALVPLPLAYLLWLIDWHAGLVLFAGIVTAAGTGLYWHIEDTERGGEEAAKAREALGVGRWAWALWQRRRLAERRVVKGRIALGTTRRGSVCWVPFGAHQGVHSLIVGATGGGKTVTQAAIAQAHILAGLPAIVVDPKGDEHLREVLIDAAARSGMPFREWSPTGSTVYNPFERGNPTEIADKAIAGQRWSEEHYREATRRLLGKVLGTLRAAGEWPPTMSQIVRHMDTERLDALGARVGGQVAEDLAEYIDGLSARARADLSGGRNRLAVLVEGELGPRLDPSLAGNGARRIGLERALSAGEVVYFHIDADRYPAASQLLAAALVTDLVSLVAKLQGGAARGLLVIDEFAALAPREVKRLFARARGAGLSLALGTQSLADLRGTDPDDSSDTFTEQVFTNVSYMVVHREADPDSAERLAGVAGTMPGWSFTRKVGGGLWQPREGTRTREREYVIGPDQFKRLRPGWAVVIQPTADPPAEVVRIFEARAMARAARRV
jgi:type IV secretion system coupling TraD/TrwB family protein